MIISLGRYCTAEIRSESFNLTSMLKKPKVSVMVDCWVFKLTISTLDTSFLALDTVPFKITVLSCPYPQKEVREIAIKMNIYLSNGLVCYKYKTTLFIK